MNKAGVVRHTAQLTLVGPTPQTSSLTPDPIIKGKILRIDITLTGPATKTTIIRIREGAAGPIRYESLNDLPPIELSPIPVYFEVSTASDLTLEVATDDGTNNTTVDAVIEVEG